jgi:hypothetical protein
MKTSAIPFITMIIASMALFSCLNEEDNYIECRSDIGFITYENGVKCAATSNGYITSTEIKSLILNECYTFGYQITDPPVNGIYKVEKVYNISEKPLTQTSLQIGKPLKIDTLDVWDIDIPIFAPSTYMGDRWVFTYSSITKERENVIASFFFDKDNQMDKNGNDANGNNEIILDIYFTKADSLNSGCEIEEKRFATVANLESLRTFSFTSEYSKNFSIDMFGGMYKSVQILFRYRKFLKSGKSEIAYLGSYPFYIVEYYNLDGTKKE